MATELNVPGVSIAVLHGGGIEWARGFGSTSIGGPPVVQSEVKKLVYEALGR